MATFSYLKPSLLGLLLLLIISEPTWAIHEGGNRKGTVPRYIITTSTDQPILLPTQAEKLGTYITTVIDEQIKCLESGSLCYTIDECCSKMCVVHPIWPPRPGRCT